MLLGHLRKTSFLGLLVFASSSWAGYLCDPACRVTASFPNGGSIDAIEATTFIFGDAGLIDTGATSTAYIKDETLTLNAGDSLVFGNGGSFTLGDLGNIDYQHLVFDSDGTITFESGPDYTSLVIGAGQNLGFKGGGDIKLNVDQLIVNGSVDLDADGNINNNGSTGSITNACTFDNSTGAAISISNGGTIDLNSGASCTSLITGATITETVFSGSLNIPQGTITGGSAIAGGNLVLSQQETSPADDDASGALDWYFLGTLWTLLALSVTSRKHDRFQPRKIRSGT